MRDYAHRILNAKCVRLIQVISRSFLFQFVYPVLKRDQLFNEVFVFLVESVVEYSDFMPLNLLQQRICIRTHLLVIFNHFIRLLEKVVEFLFDVIYVAE